MTDERGIGSWLRRAATLLLGAALVAAVVAVGATRSSSRALAVDTTTSAEVLALDLFAQAETLDLLLAEKQGGSVRLEHRRSRDGGVTWSQPVRVDLGGRGIASPRRGADPQIAAHGEAVLVVWTTPGSSSWGTGPLATAISVNGGRSWTTGPNPADDGSADGHGFTDVTIDARGHAYAAWLDRRQGAQGLRAATAAPPYRTWQANRTLDAETCECCWNRVLASERGRAWVLYRDRDPRDMAVAMTVDEGETWRRLATVGAFAWSFEGCPHVGGGLALTSNQGAERLHALVWTGADGHSGVHCLTSHDGGKRWMRPRRLGGPSARRGDLAASGPDVAAVWEEEQAIFTARSSDAGRTWTPPRRLSASTASAAYPLIAAASERFFVAWTETVGSAKATWKGVSLR